MKKNNEKKDKYSVISEIVIYIYVLFVLWAQYALMDTIFPLLPIGLFIIALAAVITKLLLKYGALCNIKLDESKPEKIEIKKLAVKVFLISLLVMMLSFYARYPGIWYVDSVNQLNQAITGEYNDWHPVLHTLLVFTIPYKIGGVWFVVFLQLVWYCVALTYMVCTLRYYRCPRWICTLIYVYMLMQPDLSYLLLFTFKDCTFVILTMILATELVSIVKTNGEWLKKAYNIVFLVTNFTICTFIRHNAILFTLPYLVAVAYFSRRYLKQCIIVLCSIAVAFLMVKVPLNYMVKSEAAEGRIMETTGICFVMMGNALKESPELVSDETKELLYSIEEENVWELYKIGNFNKVKYARDDPQPNYQALDEAGLKEILKCTAETLLNAPDQCLKAFFTVTGMVWKVEGELPWVDEMQKYDSNYASDYWLSRAGGKAVDEAKRDLPFADYIEELFGEYRKVIRDSILKYLFCYLGVLDIILLAVAFAKFKVQKSVGCLLLALPVICYNYGTSLMLANFDWRFFMYTFGCFFPIMFLMIGTDKKTYESESVTHE